MRKIWNNYLDIVWMPMALSLLALPVGLFLCSFASEPASQSVRMFIGWA